ncbi:hypothetical protein [Haloarchaeobius sp. HRN-SO-5]|uniref:hypothetical protein n=1 Tax=Haloarchaeobius sp. HRN-SO-5 TaxID=3446118 RepID=UPI003EBCB61A
MSEHVNLRIDADEKREWKEGAEEHPGVANLTQLIKVAVRRELERELTDAGHPQNGSIPEGVADTLGTIDTRTEGTQATLDAIQARLNTIETAVTEDESVSELANEVFTVLPTKHELENWHHPGVNTGHSGIPVITPSLDEIGDPKAYRGRIEDIAMAVRSDEYSVRRAIEKLQREVALVRSTEINGEKRWFKEE